MIKRKTLRTVGELRQALANFCDDMPLAIEDHGLGWGLQEPFTATRSITTYDHLIYTDDPKRGKILPTEVCVLAPGH